MSTGKVVSLLIIHILAVLLPWGPLASVAFAGSTDDRHWIPVTSFGGQIGFIDAIRSHGDDLYLGGTFEKVEGVSMRNCVRWDGERWQAVGGAVGTSTMGMVHAIVVHESDVYVAGMFDQVSVLTPASNIAHWTGVQWNTMNGGTDLAVRGIARAPNGDLYAGGEFVRAGGKEVNHIARWDGSDWYDLAGGMNQHVMVVVIHDGEVYAGGRFGLAGGKPISFVGRWDGVEWQPLGTSVDGFVTALAFKGNDLYVGGAFTTAGGKTARGIARWDGTSWHTVGTGFTGPGLPVVRALFVEGDFIYAGGFFRFVDGMPADYIARWDGNKWNALGSGLDYTVKNIARHGEDLFVTGEFTTAGGKDSPYVARWSETAAAPDAVTTFVRVGQNYPNPFNPTTTIEYALPHAAHVSLQIYDTAGRVVQTLVNGRRDAGPHTATWDGRDRRGAVVESGLYFYRLEAAGSTTVTRKMVFLK